MKTTTLTIVHR